ncbi:unnamed protein product [Moneuplotes crassus]|uniref:Uncharacterized protein n=1 Tax=Euplotes crassus TaxID=5936 RepID=A0AAD2CX35_EUPCR|nr:unnamed protein product [Moneuplotes crassus]
MAKCDQKDQEEIKINLKDPLNTGSTGFEDEATEDNDQVNDSYLLDPLLSQTTKCKRSDFFRGSDNFSKSEILAQPKLSGKFSYDSVDKISFKIKKRNKFRTYPQSCLREKSSSVRFDRSGNQISTKLKSVKDSENSKIKEEEEDEPKRQDANFQIPEENNFHISFKDQIQKKPLMMVFEVESFKKYNGEQKCCADLPCTIF